MSVTNRPAARRFALEMKKDKLYTADLKQHRERRSLDANAYFWVLCGKLSTVLGVHKDELYRELVRGIGDNFRLVDVAAGDVKDFTRMWQSKGLGWVCEPAGDQGDKITLCCYYGSSFYDTRQMSALIDLIVTECREQDIETLPPDKLAGMLEAWSEQENKSTND